jgi:predicted aspartyl protease
VHTRLLSALCLAVAVATPGGALAQGANCRLLKVADWPVRFVGNLIVVDGAINGKPVGVIVDTGAQRTLILRSSAERLDLPRQDARGRGFGVGGETKLEVATVDDFTLGQVATKDMLLLVAGEHSFGAADVLLGEDFLQRFDVEFDLANAAVRLFQAKDCAGVSLAYWTKDVVGEVEIERINEFRPRINLTVHINGKPIEAFLDSGASSTTLSITDAATMGVTPETPGVVAGRPGRGIGAQTVQTWIGPFASFAIGNETIPEVRIRFADYARTGSYSVRKMMARQPMALGADFLRSHRTLVSHSQRRLYFTYVGGPVFAVEPAPKGGRN